MDKSMHDPLVIPTPNPGMHPDWCAPSPDCQRPCDREHHGLPGAIHLGGDDVRLDLELVHWEDPDCNTGQDLADTWLTMKLYYYSQMQEPVSLILNEEDIVVLRHQLAVYEKHLKWQKKRGWCSEAQLVREGAEVAR